jgi:hypothetical protein
MSVLASSLRAAQESAEELAKKTQNPVADLISVPFQNNFNVQPVIPNQAANWQLRFQVQLLFPK